MSAAVSLLCLALVCLLCCPCSQRSPCDSTAGTRRFCGTSAPERSPCSCTKGRRSPRPVRRRSCLLPPLPLPALPACLPPPCCISLQALLLNIARRPCCLPLLPPRPVVARRRPRACRGLRRPAGGRRRRPHHVRRLAPGPLPLRRRRRPRTQPAAAQEVRGECWEEGLGGSGRGGCRGGGRCTRDEKEAAWRRDLRNAKQRCHPHSLPPPRLQVMPTPLNRLRWWRVCLDEAQMVESSTAKAAEMALKLDTVHRWCVPRPPLGGMPWPWPRYRQMVSAALCRAPPACGCLAALQRLHAPPLQRLPLPHPTPARCVTGTPLSRGLEDLFGLLAFLQVRAGRVGAREGQGARCKKGRG